MPIHEHFSYKSSILKNLMILVGVGIGAQEESAQKIKAPGLFFPLILSFFFPSHSHVI